MKSSFLVILITLLTLVSCKKDGGTNCSIYHAWEVKNFMSLESVAYPKIEGNKILLTFNKSGTFDLKLDINRCFGSFSSASANQLKIEAVGCTEACCDSQFSEKLTSMLSRVSSYKIEGNTLKLNVPQWGWIECELVK